MNRTGKFILGFIDNVNKFRKKNNSIAIGLFLTRAVKSSLNEGYVFSGFKGKDFRFINKESSLFSHNFDDTYIGNHCLCRYTV